MLLLTEQLLGDFALALTFCPICFLFFSFLPFFLCNLHLLPLSSTYPLSPSSFFFSFFLSSSILSCHFIQYFLHFWVRSSSFQRSISPESGQRREKLASVRDQIDAIKSIQIRQLLTQAVNLEAHNNDSDMLLVLQIHKKLASVFAMVKE